MNVTVYEITQDLSPDELNIIQAWRDIPGVNHMTPSHLFQISANLIDKENVNLAESSVLLAKQGFAVFDAIASIFAAKFENALLRPVTYNQGPGLSFLGKCASYPSYPAVAPLHPVL